MATQFSFNGKLIKLPGAYAQVKSGVNNPPLDFSYGNVLIIDTLDEPFGGGSGIAGEIESGEGAVYGFDNLTDFRTFIAGGKIWDTAKPLWRPNGPGSQGVSTLWYVRALTTVAAKLTINWTGGGPNGGQLRFKSRHEGLAGNGVQGDETRASQQVTITAIGAASDTIDVVANATSLGVYTSNGTDSLPIAASSLAADINANTFNGSAHGYSAVANGPVVTVFAPVNLGTTANGYSFVSNVTGTATSTVGGATMAGGVDGSKLTRGIAMTMEAGKVDTAKFIISFYRGTFVGLDNENQPYNGIAEEDTNPELIAESPEFDNIQTVIDWAKANSDFNNNLQLDETNSFATGLGTVDAADLAATTGNQLFTGGTQTYATQRVDDVLEAVAKLDYTFVLALDYGANAQSADNGKIVSHLVNEARFEKFMYVGGGDDKDTFESQSIAAANFYNSDRVVVCHGAPYVNSQSSGTGLKAKDSLYKAAHVLGRTCGLEPQTPITFKVLGYAGEVHKLSDKEKEQGLDEGVLTTGFDGDLGGFAIVQGINTLQRNSFVINEDATSHQISLKRIAAQLNKELEINIKVNLLGQQSQGPNRATLSNEIVTDYVESYLKRKTATSTADNLILSFQDIVAKNVQDAIFVDYTFVPNFEVTKVFVTGLIIDPDAQ